MNVIEEKIKYWGQLLLLPLYGSSFLMPRDKNLWLFGSTFGRRFADNPRYLYLYVNRLIRDAGKGKVRPVWISHNKKVISFLNSKGLEAYHYHSLKGIWLALRAKVYIYDNYSKDINFWQSGGALKVNLWHGVGNKRINHDNIHDKVRHPENAYEKWCTFPRRLSDEKPTDHVLCTSKEMGKYFEKAFKLNPGHIINAGYPRCDVLSDVHHPLLKVLTPLEEKLVDELDAFKQKNPSVRIIAYLPTFRASEKEFMKVMDMERFNEYLSQRDYLFVIKPHPKSVIKAALKDIHFERILTVPDETDVYTFLGWADMLVTDYSSVYTDYMLLDRPVVAFDYDRVEYEKNSRDYFISQDEYMPELKATDMDELMSCMDAAFEKDECLAARQKSRERMFDEPDFNACERVYEKIKGLLS
ncbi:MAG: CDP-glycerol glycerophosphotransferase family protein [Lachnospiraceae bacterium]|nr:CDP-glycerol glycerophosphotransferase family protein [Lachnospiraceae bacterium]